MAKKKTIKAKEYIAAVNKRIGSNSDGSPKLHFQVGKPITLTLSQARTYKNYLK